MRTFKQFMDETPPMDPVADYDFDVQAFMGMDAYDITENATRGLSEEVDLVELTEARIEGERGDAKWDHPKYAKIRSNKQAKLEAVYGKSDAPLSNKEIAAHSLATLKHHDSLSPKAQKENHAAALSRRKAAGLGGHLAGNQKNETANDVHTGGKKNHTYGISGSPAQYSHITKGGEHKIVNTCVNATASCGGTGKERGTGGSCLAQKAQGQQHTTRASRDHYSQGERHNHQSNADHVLTMAHEIRTANKKANASE